MDQIDAQLDVALDSFEVSVKVAERVGKYTYGLPDLGGINLAGFED